jgi:1,4-alpha-glucan branching enzyme
LTVREEIDRLLARDHPEPHRLLGAHASREGVVFRCFKPGAEWIRVLPEGHEPFRLRRIHKDGVFAGTLPGVESPPRYELEVSYPDWEVAVEHDPYAFLPSVGELDLHLAAEGRHEELHHVLGAHPREIEGVEGVSFAVWAPSARSISVVGDFNGWDGRVHPMRTLGAAGIWELFLPAAREGAIYKYEIRTASG